MKVEISDKNTNKRGHKPKFGKLIRVISYILIITFLWQDVVWAYPDPSEFKAHKLAPQGLFKGQDKEEGFRFWTALQIHKAISKETKTHPLKTIENLIPSIKTSALQSGLTGLVVMGSLLVGEPYVHFGRLGSGDKCVPGVAVFSGGPEPSAVSTSALSFAAAVDRQRPTANVRGPAESPHCRLKGTCSEMRFPPRLLRAGPDSFQ